MSPNKRSPEELLRLKAELEKLAVEGKTQGEAANALGLKRPQVIGLAARLGIKFGSTDARRSRKKTRLPPPAFSPQPKKEEEPIAPKREPPSPAALAVIHRKQVRRNAVAACMWSGCSNPPVALHKPFCREHNK